MALNGSELVNDPWNTTWSSYTDLFENMVGVGAVFWLIPLCILTLGIYIKTNNPVMATMFMIGSGALLSSGSIFLGSPDMQLAFIVFTAMGLVGLFASLLFQRR